MSFIPTGSSVHDLHTATLLQSGQVLLTGGEADGLIPTSETDLYDSVNGRFQPTGNMNIGRESDTATLLRDGRVLIAGGARLEGLNWKPLSTAEIYEPTNGAFSKTGSMSDARYFHTATILVDRERRIQ